MDKVTASYLNLDNIISYLHISSSPEQLIMLVCFLEEIQFWHFANKHQAKSEVRLTYVAS